MRKTRGEGHPGPPTGNRHPEDALVFGFQAYGCCWCWPGPKRHLSLRSALKPLLCLQHAGMTNPCLLEEKHPLECWLRLESRETPLMQKQN